jgi:cellulose biosynthesis protein BcsQ
MEPAPTASGTLAGVGGLNWRKDASAAFDEAKRTGKPVLLYDVSSTGARSYLELARELMKRETVDGR